MTHRSTVVALLALALTACTLKEEAGSKGKGIPAPPDVAAAPADAVRTPTGLASKIMRVGLGSVHPGPHSQVTAFYTGWTTDGKMFESVQPPAPPLAFKVDGVIAGWSEGLQLMFAGEKRRFWIPAALAYGEKPLDPNSPAGNLVFDIELITVR